MTKYDGLHGTIEQYHSSLGHKDLDKVLGAYTADTLIVSSGGEYYYGDERPDRGKAVISLLWGDFVGYPAKKVVLNTVELQVFGQIAYELCSYHLAISSSKVEEGIYLAIWKHQDGDWKIGLQTFSSGDTPLTGLW